LTDTSSVEPEAPLQIASAEQGQAPRQANQRRIIYFDLETQRSALEVGGWQNAHLMMVSVAVAYDSLEDRFYAFTEDQLEKLIRQLTSADLVIGFNIKRFDYAVLQPYTPVDLGELPTFDLLEEIFNRLRYRISLDHLATETLGRQKSGDGLKALEWFKAGEIDMLTEYCKDDVILTRDLFLHGLDKGYLIYRDKGHNERLRFPVDWDLDRLIDKIRE
jgi:DEAD/DEAH box helicase domain-containing protein